APQPDRRRPWGPNGPRNAIHDHQTAHGAGRAGHRHADAVLAPYAPRHRRVRRGARRAAEPCRTRGVGLMSTAQTWARRPQPHASTAGRRWGLAGLAVAWYLLSTFIALGLPNVAVVLVLGLLVMLSVQPDSRFPERGVAPCRRNLVLALVAAAAFVPVGAGMDLLLGRIPIEAGHAVLATCAAV